MGMVGVVAAGNKDAWGINHNISFNIDNVVRINP
jgi:hypothetical protein